MNEFKYAIGDKVFYKDRWWIIRDTLFKNLSYWSHESPSYMLVSPEANLKLRRKAHRDFEMWIDEADVKGEMVPMRMSCSKSS